MRGHIRKRSGPAGVSYQVIVPTTRDPISGRVRQVSATAHTKREAEELLSRMLSEVHGGQHGGPDVSMGELFERWYELASPDWSPKTALENSTPAKPAATASSAFASDEMPPARRHGTAELRAIAVSVSAFA